MEIFITFLLKLIPLYVIILLGYVATSRLHAKKETIAGLLIYIIAPVIIFYGAYSASLDVKTLLLPLIFFALCCCMSLLFLWLGNKFYGEDSTSNILSFTAGTGNTGYFGLPVVLLLFGDQAFSIAVLCILGFVLFENSLGYFISAKGNHSIKDSINKVLRLPTMYAFFIGLLFNYLAINLDSINTTIEHFKGAYTLLGMMIIGMSLVGIGKKHIDYTFLGLSFLAKFIVWPGLIMLLIYTDKTILHLFNNDIYNVFIVMSIVPLAANTVAVATELNVHPDKAAIAVLLSTIVALFYIPLLISIVF